MPAVIRAADGADAQRLSPEYGLMNHRKAALEIGVFCPKFAPVWRRLRARSDRVFSGIAGIMVPPGDGTRALSTNDAYFELQDR